VNRTGFPCRARALALALASLSLLAACDESFVKGWRVDRTRVLGARIEAAAAPERATIAAGERVRASWLVGAPNGVRHLEWAFALCGAPTGNMPEPRCEGVVFASGAGASDSETVAMEMDVPGVPVLGPLGELILLAVFCEQGRAGLESGGFVGSCEGGAPPILASATIKLAPAATNQNPPLAPDAVRFDGAVLPPATLRVGGPCTGSPDAPVALAGTKHGFALVLSGAEREPMPGSPNLETIIVSHVVTAGELDRQYSALEPNEAPKTIEVPWTAPGATDVPEGSRLVEAFFVLRDGRGGEVFTRRTICARRDP
jgi:hypothetical protein